MLPMLLIIASLAVPVTVSIPAPQHEEPPPHVPTWYASAPVKRTDGAWFWAV